MSGPPPQEHPAQTDGGDAPPPTFPLPVWVRRNDDSWLEANLEETCRYPASLPAFDTIERVVTRTDKIGPRPLWPGYGEHLPRGRRSVPWRTPRQVRTKHHTGIFFASLIVRRCPSLVVEIGTAFGVSGMYWLAGLEHNGTGTLVTFEPNEAWAAVARQNLAQIGERVRCEIGTFEERSDAALDSMGAIDLAFIDGIHSSDVVLSQFSLLLNRIAPGGLIVLDDIDYSEDMQMCWEQVSRHERVIAGATLTRRVGIIELC